MCCPFWNWTVGHFANATEELYKQVVECFYSDWKQSCLKCYYFVISLHRCILQKHNQRRRLMLLARLSMTATHFDLAGRWWKINKATQYTTVWQTSQYKSQAKYWEGFKISKFVGKNTAWSHCWDAELTVRCLQSWLHGSKTFPGNLWEKLCIASTTIRTILVWGNLPQTWLHCTHTCVL